MGLCGGGANHRRFACPALGQKQGRNQPRPRPDAAEEYRLGARLASCLGRAWWQGTQDPRRLGSSGYGGVSGGTPQKNRTINTNSDAPEIGWLTEQLRL
jgi:hypothetical protein